MTMLINRIKLVFGLINYLGLINLLYTIYFNLRYFDLRTAWRLPVWISKDVKIRALKRNSIKFVDGIRSGILSFGLIDLDYCYNHPSKLYIDGKLIVKGMDYHSFAPGAILYISKGASMEINDKFSTSHDVKIYCSRKIVIGKNNMWSFFNIIMDTDSHPIFDGGGIMNPNQEIIFGDNVWLGCRCTVLKGVHIANNTIIGSNSIVRKDITEENTCNAGNGPVKIHSNINWKRDLLL